MKKIIITACIFSILSINTAFGKDITVTVNDMPIPYTQNPVIKNNTTYVPMKQTAEAFGAVVSWNEPTKTVIARKGSNIISACVNSKTLMITKNGKTQNIVMETPAYIENGTMFVPLRPLTQVFHANIIWDKNTNIAKITNNSFIISEKTEQKTIQNKEGVTVWEAHISYPELQRNSEAFSKINEIISNDVHTSLSDTENEIVADDINTDLDNMLPYTFDCTYSITYLDDNTISILLDYYELTGGAHGMPYRQAYTFDLNTGNQLQLKDILNLSETDITEFVKNAFKNNIEQNPDNYFTGAVETVDSEHFMYDFYIEPNKIIFFTQAYLLEPYANHYQPTIVNIEELQNKLKINISTNGF